MAPASPDSAVLQLHCCNGSHNGNYPTLDPATPYTYNIKNIHIYMFMLLYMYVSLECHNNNY